ncbi:MAG: putative methyl-accepting chemotaxis [Beijerinckiaceae bacterium]|nr:MAG: putative methyl-accepting chemotaxis [Beijerinckiaceae bacterium]
MQTTSSKIVATTLALLVGVILLAGVAWLAQSREVSALSGIHDRRIIPLRDLKIIGDHFSVRVVDAAHKARSGWSSFKEVAPGMRAALTEIDGLWNQYIAGVIDADESARIEAGKEAFAQARGAITTLTELLEKNDRIGLVNFVEVKMYSQLDPVAKVIGELINLQIAKTREVHAASMETAATTRIVLFALITLAMLTAGWAVYFALFGISRPLRRAIITMNNLARYTVGAEDLGTNRLSLLASIEIRGTDRRDELGEMARTLLTFQEAGVERQRLRLEAETDQKARHERALKVEELIAEFEHSSMSIVASVATTSAELEASAKMMLEVAQTTSEQSTLVAAASHQASQSVQTLSSNGDELAMSITEIGRQAEQSSRFASEAATKARATDETVMRLNLAGKAIIEVVDLIRSIAAQTNLLALNATIEAARAGESGRGFAVVASEVKELASQTSRATDVINEHVQAIQTASTDSIDAMREITRMIEEINQVAASIATAVTEQSQATQGIAENVQQVAQGTAHAAESIAIVNEAAANTGAAASQVLSASEELAHQGQMMRQKVDWFLHEVRAA